ncbi:MAG TPA: class F sortase [Candidatus Dormibacteraeota bacterium]|nr:class F sortase [Candidatus Dormibacteraeota bacterium]
MRSFRRLLLAGTLPAVLLLGGAGFVLLGLAGIRLGPPLPAYPAPVPGAHVWASKYRLPGLDASAPVQLSIPALGVQAPIIPVGLGPDGTVGVPPISQPALTGWYRYGVTPGQNGSSVILGHVDSWVSGPAVFYRLGALKVGDVIQVVRQDGRTVQFRVDAVSAFDRTRIPLSSVYGQVPYPGLRLITCGGSWDAQRQIYTDNVVVFASMTAVSPF